MFCPKCATENLDGLGFCRSCGQNLSVVQQALSEYATEPPRGARLGRSRRRARTGRLVKPDTGPLGGVSLADIRLRSKEKKERPPRLDKGVKELFSGIGFLFVAFCVYAYAPAGAIWWFWMLIPAFTGLGAGTAEILRYREMMKANPVRPNVELEPGYTTPQINGVPLNWKNEAQPSVTEGTTRTLGVQPDLRK